MTTLEPADCMQWLSLAVSACIFLLLVVVALGLGWRHERRQR